MRIARGIPEADFPVLPADQDDRKLGLEFDESFVNQGHVRQVQTLGIAVRTNAPLALAVISVAPRLENARCAQSVDRGFQIGARIDAGIRRRSAAEPFDDALLVQPVLRGFERARMREYPVFGDRRRRGDGHVLEFPGDGIALRREGGDCGCIVPFVGEDVVAHVADDIVALGRVGDAAIAELGRADRHHPAKLAATQYPDRAAALQHQPTGRSVTAALRAARQSCRRCDTAVS